ncbi:hypothetical protein [Jeotgalibacillus terrae]|uniref:Uncharacterized protein n=1 Tax=Jeotgalibacillus terrae TaxID=587735 RepID=A0ABW5ZHA7_9BACL|nr:hypothetical protein [Jeotgalibacillus terrae]MBM7577658.1 hypothetical protein [Jeotgalibacillus terrae]
MAKKTWINISGTWTEVKNVWQNVGGVWKEKVLPKGNISGVWKEFMQYLVQIYKEGIEYIPMVQARLGGTGSFVEKRASDIRIRSGGQFNNENTSVATDIPIDLTNLSTLYVDWAASGPGDFSVAISPVKNSYFQSYTARIRNGSNFSRRVQSLDISSLSGEYYIIVHCVSGNLNFADVYLYELRIE